MKTMFIITICTLLQGGIPSVFQYYIIKKLQKIVFSLVEQKYYLCYSQSIMLVRVQCYDECLLFKGYSEILLLISLSYPNLP